MLEYFLKNIHKRDILKLWEEFLNAFKLQITIDKERGYVYMESFLWCTEAKVPEDKQQGEIVRTIAQKYIDEGRESDILEEIEKGMEKTAINMLKQKLDSFLISTIPGLSSTKILQLENRI